MHMTWSGRGQRLTSIAVTGIAIAAAGIAVTHRTAQPRTGDMPLPMQERTHEGHEGHAASQAGTRPATVVTVVSCEKLAHVPGKTLTTMLVDFPPGAYTPRHRHGGSVMAYVVSGTVRSQLAGGPPGVFGVGQSWYEPPGIIHEFAENASATEPARVLAVFVADDRAQLTTPLQYEVER
jgi:quercetin dioxygenase-like cupin family protein